MTQKERKTAPAEIKMRCPVEAGIEVLKEELKGHYIVVATSRTHYDENRRMFFAYFTIIPKAIRRQVP